MIAKSFDDCPYNCINGKIFDFDSRKYKDCPHCKEKRKELLDKGIEDSISGDTKSLAEELGISNKFLSDKLNYNYILPEQERLFLNEDSVTFQEKTLTDIYLGLTIGELPTNSYCFGISNKGKIDAFAYPLLAKAYLSGLSICPLISCNTYAKKQFDMEDLEEFLNKDFAIMLIPEGSTKTNIYSAKGFMQERAIRNKPTIFITTWSIEACSMLLSYPDDETYLLAKQCFLTYKSSGGRSKYIQNLTGVTNEELVSNGDNRPSSGPTITFSSLIE